MSRRQRMIATLEHMRDIWDVQYVPRRLAELCAPKSAGLPVTVGRAKGSVTAGPATGQVDGSGGSKTRLRDQARLWSSQTKLEYLRTKNVGDCKRCSLHRTRKTLVFGVGNPDAKIMFVGEAPGADEDRLGEPFVGRAGQRLQQWLVERNLRREDVYIANVLKCRPPGNRDPQPDEVDRCAPFLKAQIRAIGPRVLVALGRHAGMFLAGRNDLSLRAMRSSQLHYDASVSGEQAWLVPLVVTYHPAYILRQESSGDATTAKDAVHHDLERALRIVEASA